jgi:hypothetical protein
MTSGQLGKLATICKSQKHLLQDAYHSVRKHMEVKGLVGRQAFLYLQSCLVQNPNRDWKGEARRRAGEADEFARRGEEDAARAELLQKLHTAGAAGVELPLAKGRITQAEDPAFVYHHRLDGGGACQLRTVTDVLANFPSMFSQR